MHRYNHLESVRLEIEINNEQDRNRRFEIRLKVISGNAELNQPEPDIVSVGANSNSGGVVASVATTGGKLPHGLTACSFTLTEIAEPPPPGQ